MKPYIDLHIHSIYSDGEFWIEDLITEIKKRVVGTFSITDHDNIDSVKHMNNLDLGELNYIRGVEISSKIKDYNVHLLGYDFNGNTADLDSLLKRISQKRIDRFVDMMEGLHSKYQIEISKEDIARTISTKTSIGKPHIIELLYMYGYGTSNKEIYEKYLKNHKSSVSYRVPLADSINAIKSANGFAILAHPKEVEKEYNIDINDIIKDLIGQGIDGIEVYNSLHNLKDIKRYLEVAKKYNLLISGGSDYHGIFTKPNVIIGNVSHENTQIKHLTLVDKIHHR